MRGSDDWFVSTPEKVMALHEIPPMTAKITEIDRNILNTPIRLLNSETLH